MLDTDTGIEWLNIFATSGLSMSQVKASIASGTLQGWRIPTNAEVESMYTRFFHGFNMNVHEYQNVSNSTLKSRISAFKTLLGSPAYDHTKAAYYDENGILRPIGVFVRNSAYYMYGLNTTVSSITDGTKSASTGGYFQGFLLVSDGGTTLSSVNNPALNINNPNAPINQVPETPADVPVHAGFGVLGLLLMAFGLRRRNSA